MRKTHGPAIGRTAWRGWACDTCGSRFPDRPPAGATCGCGGTSFSYWHSKVELQRSLELRLLEKSGAIRNLERQVRLPLKACHHDREPVRIGHYVADFTYEERSSETTTGRAWERIVEDVKGADTPLAAWKRRHYALQEDVVIRIIRK